MSNMPEPILIMELGLHGEGELDYHKRIVDGLVSWWPGWPNIVVKTQSWFDTDSPWVQEIRRCHGRMPLRALPANAHRQLSNYCRDRGLLYGVTMHDEASFEMLDMMALDYAKLGSFDATNENLVKLLASNTNRTGYPRPIWSEGIVNGPDWISRKLACANRYPANVSFISLCRGHRKATGERQYGYSCHSVPKLAIQEVTEAAKFGCHTLEVHVTARPPRVRPLPADYCVSLSVYQFARVARKLGQIWSKEA